MGATNPAETVSKGRILLRGLTKRCPRCGENPIFTSWMEMEESCPQCGLIYEQEEGYWTGSLTLNTVITLFMFGFIILGVALATWPDTPVLLLVSAGVIGVSCSRSYSSPSPERSGSPWTSPSSTPSECVRELGCISIGNAL